MGFLIRVICQMLLFHGALQCYQARLEFSDQGFGEIDNSFRELNELEVKNTDLLESSHNNEGKETNEIQNDDDNTEDNGEEHPKIHDDSEEKRRGGQHRRLKADKRRVLKNERMHNRHQNRQGSDGLENSLEEERADHDRETVHFYMSKPSDIANMSAMLGPGPVSIQIVDPTTQKTTSTTRISNSTKLGLDDTRNAANISMEIDDLVSLVGEHRRGNKRKFKHNDSHRKTNKHFITWNDEYIPVKQHKKESRMFHKQNLHIYPNERENTNQKAGHKKRKHKKKFHNEAVNTRKDIEKYHLNDEEQYTNLSVINKSFQTAARNKLDFKNRVGNPVEGELTLGREEPHELARKVVEKISDEDAKKICLINAEREMSEEGHTSLRDETAEVEKKNDNVIPRNNPRKGIRSKIDHGDWVDIATILPLPDYSIKRNKTLNNKKLISVFDSYNRSRKHKKKKYVDINNEDGALLVQSSNEFQGPELRNEYVSDVLLDDDEETQNKRDERDTESRVIRHNFKSPKERSIFSRHTDSSGETGDEMYDVDTKQDEQSYSKCKNNHVYKNRNHEISEKGEEDYEYDAHLNGNEKTITEVSITNRTIQRAQSTCAPTTDTIHSTKPTTRKTNKPKTTLRANDNSESAVNNDNVTQRNKTIDPYELFLCGQLADNFVDEVLKKVKISRKISRELGFSNDTEETCDRCVELKPIKVPELSVMRSSLGKCLRSNAPVQNCSMCCGVPKPMAKYLDVLVYFEKENGNNFYNKIQDDSSFIFTGDYTEQLLKGENGIKTNDKYVDAISSLNKDTFDRQRLREDLNEEKEDKSASSDSLENPKEKLSTGHLSGDDTISESVEIGRNKETQGETKRYLRRFGKSQIDGNKERSSPGFEEIIKDNDFEDGLNYRDSVPLVKEHLSKEPDSNSHPHRGFGRVMSFGGTKKENALKSLNKHREPEKSVNRNFERFYGQSNYDYFKSYTPKSSQDKLNLGYKLNYDNSLRNSLPKDSRDHDGFYKLPNYNRMSNTGHEQVKLKDNYLGYPPKKYSADKKTNRNENYKGYQTKYDLLYEDNGEYSLYPNLESRSTEEDVARMSEGENARLVKRGADNDANPVPVYDDEPNVFFEIPDIEYDLYK